MCTQRLIGILLDKNNQGLNQNVQYIYIDYVGYVMIVGLVTPKLDGFRALDVETSLWA
jgi:hypothetical protein